MLPAACPDMLPPLEVRLSTESLRASRHSLFTARLVSPYDVFSTATRETPSAESLQLGAYVAADVVDNCSYSACSKRGMRTKFVITRCYLLLQFLCLVVKGLDLEGFLKLVCSSLTNSVGYRVESHLTTIFATFEPMRVSQTHASKSPLSFGCLRSRQQIAPVQAQNNRTKGNDKQLTKQQYVYKGI